MSQVKSERQKLLARIHLGKKQRGLSEEEYRALVSGYGASDSAADLDSGELRALAQCLAPSWPKQGKASFKQQGFIRGLWQQKARHPDEKSLNAWLEHHWGASQLRDLEKYRASQIIKVLGKWHDAQ